MVIIENPNQTIGSLKLDFFLFIVLCLFQCYLSYENNCRVIMKDSGK